MPPSEQQLFAGPKTAEEKDDMHGAHAHHRKKKEGEGGQERRDTSPSPSSVAAFLLPWLLPRHKVVPLAVRLDSLEERGGEGNPEKGARGDRDRLASDSSWATQHANDFKRKKGRSSEKER